MKILNTVTPKCGPRSDCSICVTQPSAEFVFLKNQKDYKILL